MAFVGAQIVNAVSPNPVGSLQAYAGSSAPTGWLLCDGTSYSTSVYPELFSVLGYTYGGSGANFNVPDLRGRVPMGAGSGAGLTARTRGQTTGAETHTLTTAQIPSHDHSLGPGQNFGTSFGGNAGGVATFGLAVQIINTNTYQGPYVVGFTGGGGSHNNVQPSLVVNYIIRAISETPRSGVAYGSTPPIVTQLPANPQFGDVVTYIADAVNGVAWNLQYDASGTYPWKFIGGAPWMEYAAGGNVAGATSSYTLLTGYTVALPGDYMVTVEVGFAIGTTAAATYCESGPVLNSEAFSYPNVASLYSSTANVGGPLVKTRRITAPSVGGVLRGIFQPNPVAGSFNRITETVTPVRVKAP